MRKIVTLVVCAAGVLALGIANAAPTTTSKVGDSVKAEQAKSDFILLYDKPSNGKVVQRLAPNARLVPIYQDGNWVKVGNPRNGDTGWVNLVEYQKARYNYYRPDIQTLYVHINNTGKSRPTLNVIAYKNGKKLTEKEASALYKRLRSQEKAQFQRVQKLSWSMQSMMDQDVLNAEHFMNAAWDNPPWMAPVILVPVASDDAGAVGVAHDVNHDATQAKPAAKNNAAQHVSTDLKVGAKA